MKVLIPTSKNRNSFFEELTSLSSHKFFFKDLNEDVAHYDLVLIHWPEELFGWKEPSKDELDFLKMKLQSWRKDVKIVYMVHNLKPHNKAGKYYNELYELVLSYCQGMIHLGNYSKDLLSKKYPDKSHTIIYHPLYRKSFTTVNKQAARQRLGLSQDAVIIIAPGRIRTFREKELITKSFKRIKSNKKELIVPRMFWKESKIEFKGRNGLKKLIDIKSVLEKIYNFSLDKRHHFFYSFMDNKELSILMSASDIVFVPRLNTLNSGILFLGLSFDKTIVGPRVGNLTEVLNLFNCYSYDPFNLESVKESLNAAVNNLDSKIMKTSKKNELKFFEPKYLAKQFDDYLVEILEKP